MDVVSPHDQVRRVVAVEVPGGRRDAEPVVVRFSPNHDVRGRGSVQAGDAAEEHVDESGAGDLGRIVRRRDDGVTDRVSVDVCHGHRRAEVVGEHHAFDDRVRGTRRARSHGRAVEDVGPPDRGVPLARSDQEVGQLAAVHVPRGRGPAQFLEVEARDHRVRLRETDLAAHGPVEEVRAAGEARDEVVGGRADDEILVAVIVDVAGRSHGPAEAVLDSARLSAERDVGRRAGRGGGESGREEQYASADKYGSEQTKPPWRGGQAGRHSLAAIT